MRKSISLYVLFICFIFCIISLYRFDIGKIQSYDEGVLVWEDTFDTLDQSIWVNGLGFVRNNEVLCYVDNSENIFCKDG